MKRFLTVVCLNIMILGFSSLKIYAQEEAAKNYQTPKFQLILSGDLGYAIGNSGLEDYSEFQGQSAANQYNSIASAKGIKGGFKVDETSKANVAYGVDLEMRFFGENLGLGLGTGIHTTDTTTKVSSPNYSDQLKYELTLTTLPLIATLYYKNPVSENSFVTIGAGAGYYFGMLDGELSSNAPIPPTVNVAEPIADGSTIGYHIRADYNYLVGPISFTAGVMGRYVKFDEFKDTGAPVKIDCGLTGFSIYAGVGFAIM